MIKLVIGGDICPTRANIPHFVEGRTDLVFNDLMDEFQAADLLVANMECPLTENQTPIAKYGPCLRAPVTAIAAIQKAGFDVLNLANNHILDYGDAGLESTLVAARTAGIQTVGGGRNRNEARRILICPVKGVRVGILGVAEHEFSIATDSAPGANPLDLIDITRNIAAQRNNFDYLVVLVHGGNEHYVFPSPRLMETCRYLVEQGANAVICQHSHCVGCSEEYQGGHIVYGQGNLIFDSTNPTQGWNEGLLVQLSISSDGKSQMELVPFEQSRSGPGARKMTQQAAQALLQTVAERSNKLLIPGFVQEQWQEFCRKKRHWYLNTAMGHGRILRRLDRYGLLIRLLHSASTRLAMENVIRCEAHRDVLSTLFDDMHDKNGR